MRKMDWNLLKIFLAVAERKSLIDAAKHLHISHTTVFRKLKVFEEKTGAHLFDRSGGGYELTESGEELLVYARSISDAFDSLDRSIIGKDVQPRGKVILTAPSSFSYFHLPQMIDCFNQEYKDIQLDLRVTNTELNMNRRDADIAIRVGSSPPDHLVGREVAAIKWGVYAGIDSSGLSLPGELEELEQHRLIGASGLLENTRAFSYLEQKFSGSIGIKCDDLVGMSSLAQNGFGIAILPDEFASPNLKRLFTYKPGGVNKVWILTHPDLRKVERIKIVMKYLSAKFSKYF